MYSNHPTPRMGNRPHDPAFILLDARDQPSVQRVHRKGCFICEDREFARMGLPLCSPCCACREKMLDGHIPADETECDDCGHELCQACSDLPAQEAEICTCDTPCCEVDVGVGTITCGGQHCPTHGMREEDVSVSP